MHRRTFLSLAAAGTLTAGCSQAPSASAQPANPLNLSDAEWRKKLGNGEAYAVLRQEATERPYTSSLLKEKRAGTYVCRGCDLALFSSDTKYDSGTGWPSFWQALPGAFRTKTDYKIGIPRTEYSCTRCGGHHGHIFDDGPRPTGKRYCNNGVALKFIAA